MNAEVDEAYFGGRQSNQPPSRRAVRRGTKGKMPVIGIKGRETGKVAAAAAPSVTAEKARRFTHAHTAPGATINTDDSTVYHPLTAAGYNHRSVKHSISEW